MKLPGLAAPLALAFGTLSATAGSAETIRIGVIAPFSGPFATYGTQYRDAIGVYQAEHGTTVGDYEIEIIYKDVGGVDPDTSKALAQELLVRERVDYLAGFTFTPNALAVAPLIDQSQTPTVIFNAATSIITEESDFFVRASFTLWQVAVPMAQWAHDQGMMDVVTAVTDYGPGIDAEEGFRAAFEDLGGTVSDAIRMPIQTTDFAPFAQRIKDAAPDAVFTFLPVGPPTFAFVKAYDENGLAEAGITFLGTGETDETTLQQLGDAALGLKTSYHYSMAHDSDANRAFLAGLAEIDPEAVANFASVGAYDGMHLLYRMIEAGGSDPAALDAVKGLEWESPRGPVSIDSETRHITQNVYLREVARDETGTLVNEELEVIREAAPDYGLTMKE